MCGLSLLFLPSTQYSNCTRESSTKKTCMKIQQNNIITIIPVNITLITKVKYTQSLQIHFNGNDTLNQTIGSLRLYPDLSHMIKEIDYYEQLD